MSRKKQNIQKITALYCRLSLEDGRENESMSISNQKLMLKDFAEKNGMFRYEYYVDDGYTGRNFNRPAFQRMIADIEAGKIDCVITKDLSRLGRNYIEAGSYIEIFFPKHHIRYIAITENGIDYILVGDYYIPDLKLPEEHRPIGKYGRMHREYLREVHPARLNTLILTGELWTYLADLNEQAQERLDTIMEQMKTAEGVTEELKRTHQMEWVQRCNNIHNRAEEIVLHEMIYS